MGKRKRAIPQYGTVTLNGIDYYRTRVQNADGKLVALYARTPEELYDKELGALEQIDNDTFCRKSPTVADYCEKWLLMQSVHVRANTLIDYTSKVRRHIIKELGQMRMADVTLDDIQLALVPVSEKSASVYKSVVILYKSIFRAAKESKIIDNNPTIYLGLLVAVLNGTDRLIGGGISLFLNLAIGFGIEACVVVLITTCLGAIVINLSRNIIVTSVVGVIYGFASCLFIGSENGFVIPGSFAYRVSMFFSDKSTYYDSPVLATIGGCISFVLCFAVMFLVGLLVFSHKKKIEN